jgi:hypothetical protein
MLEGFTVSLSVARDQGSEIRDQRSEIRDQRAGVRGQGSGVRGQGSGVRGQGGVLSFCVLCECVQSRSRSGRPRRLSDGKPTSQCKSSFDQ